MRPVSNKSRRKRQGSPHPDGEPVVRTCDIPHIVQEFIPPDARRAAMLRKWLSPDVLAKLEAFRARQAQGLHVVDLAYNEEDQRFVVEQVG